jgi:hypothetical protein
MESLICEKFCDFYKPGREEREKCGTFEFLRRNLTLRELKRASEETPKGPDRSADTAIKDMACSGCGFLPDGCDFRAGSGDTPCGGYAIVNHLLKNAGNA